MSQVILLRVTIIIILLPYRQIPLHWVVVHNMISLSLDPADPALRALIIQAASHEFVTHRLTSHAMLLMGIFYGKLQMIAITKKVFY